MFTINDAILNPYTRAEGVQQLAAWIIQVNGGTRADVIKAVKKIHETAGKPVPTDAEIEFWMDLEA